MKTIRILGLILSASLLFSACSTSNDTEAKKAKLEAKKLELSKLKAEIKTLETDVANASPQQEDKGTLIKAETLKPETFIHSFEINGSLDAVESAVISPETSGQLQTLLVKEGEHVKVGQVLARLNTKLIQSNINEVKVGLDLASRLYEKQKSLWDQKIGSEIDYLNAKNAKESLEAKLKTLQTQMDMSIIKSPINGVVDKIYLKEGEMAMPGVSLMQVINLDMFYIQSDVAESHLPSLHVGDEVKVFFPAYPSLNTTTKIYRIGNVINPENRSFLVEIKLKNSEGKLKPNMLALTRFIDYQKDNALVVPASIVKNDFKGAYLYIVNKKEGKTFAKKVYVSPGLTMGNSTHITGGLSAGDQVIVEGYNKIVDGSKIDLQ